MMSEKHAQTTQMIPIDRINIINPRVRNKRSFKQIVENVSEVGLKKPVTVTLRNDADGPRYDLVCGQGRVEAYQVLGQKEIPALVIDAGTEDCLVRSLVENCARRKHSAIELLRDIQGMQQRGYCVAEIAKKTGLTDHYVRDVVRLLEKGEERLLRAVDSGQIPVTVAIEIAESDDAGVQNTLRQAYEKKILRGRKFMLAKQLVEQRRRRGKKLSARGVKRETGLSTHALIRAYRQDADKKRVMIQKANVARNRLIFVTEAFRRLFADENFVTLLRAEGLETLPAKVADRIRNRGASAA